MNIEINSIDFDRNSGTAKQSFQKGLHASPPSEDAYKQSLTEINETYRMIVDPVTGMQFENAVVNTDMLDENAVMKASTYGSSLTQNVGNAIELAAFGASNRRTAGIYLAAHDTGGSSRMLRDDRKVFRRTGRFTTGSEWGSYRALESLYAAARALQAAGLVPNHISGDESGGRLALGMATALEPGTIKDGYLNGIPGISADTKYAQVMVKEDNEGRKQRREQTEYQPGEITPASQKEARSLMPNIYSGLGQRALLAQSFLHMPRNVAMNTYVYSKKTGGLDKPATHGALQDTIAALQQQDALLTFRFNEQSGIHPDMDACIMMARLALSAIPDTVAGDRRGIRIQIGKGSLDSHTQEPAERIASERKALDSIHTFLHGIRGGKLPETQPAIPAVAMSNIRRSA